MDPTQPEQPERPDQPAPAAEPVVQWQPSPDEGRHAPGPGTGELFNNRPAASLRLMDAITTGFTILGKPTFIGPVLVIGIIVNAIVRLVLAPVASTLAPASTTGDFSSFNSGAFAGTIFGSVTLAILGGVILNLYAQIWASAATSGPLPTFNQVIELLKTRWTAIIGTGLVVAAILIGLLIALVLVVTVGFVALGPLGLILMLAGLVGYAYVSARLSMAGWLAASGGGITESVNGSWRITERNLLRIIGWSLAYGFVFAIVTGILGAVLGLVPVVGPALTQTIGSALGYGAGVTLFRRTQAAAGALAPGAPAQASSLAS